MNILIVDDEIPAVQGILKAVGWEKLGIANSYTASSVAEAIEKFSAHDIELLLTDIEMREGTGFDLIRWANERSLRHVSIILSGFPNFRYAQRAISLGVFEYLLKPVDYGQLELVLRRSAEHLKKIRSQINMADRPHGNSIIELTKNYIYEHISREISRDDLAAHLGFSPTYLSTLFKKETGNTLSDFIKAERIHFARKLLKQTNLPISVISENVGYESLSYFSSVFRQLSGCTPREYRNIEHTA